MGTKNTAFSGRKQIRGFYNNRSLISKSQFCYLQMKNVSYYVIWKSSLESQLFLFNICPVRKINDKKVMSKKVLPPVASRLDVVIQRLVAPRADDRLGCDHAVPRDGLESPERYSCSPLYQGSQNLTILDSSLWIYYFSILGSKSRFRHDNTLKQRLA